MLNVLRLSDGFSTQLLEDRLGEDRLLVRTMIDQAVADGMLESPSVEIWRPTARGFRFLNDLQARFLP
jgi:coproporphyrinogen III oxidase-like Fe-S oxidoreductase